jgi:hypothetical protein
MTSFQQTAFALGLVASMFASGGASAPVSDTTEAAVNGDGTPGSNDGQLCEATPAPTARCAAACPYGYKGASGTHTCECCTGPSMPGDGGGGDGASDGGAGDGAATDGGAGDGGEICGGPPPTARCSMACPNGYKQIDGQPTCQCCSN